MCKIYCHKDYYDGEHIITTPKQDDGAIVVLGLIFMWAVLITFFLVLTNY